MYTSALLSLMRSSAQAGFNQVLAILNNCPEHDQGILFAFFGGIQPDPYYGMRVVYDGQEGPRGIYVVALVACASKSQTEQVSDKGYKVITCDGKGIANHEGTAETPVGSYTLVGYRSIEGVTGFRLDKPRGKIFRFAVVLLTKADETDGFHIPQAGIRRAGASE